MYNEIKTILNNNFPNAEINLEGEGCSFTLAIKDEGLMKLSPIKRQQAIYQHLNHFIADGRIHAISMKFS